MSLLKINATLQKEEEMLMTGSAIIITPFQGEWKKIRDNGQTWNQDKKSRLKNCEIQAQFHYMARIL